jgi:leucyl-tRNA synthetase
MSAIGAAEGAQHKKLAKGKAAVYDPNKEKKLSIFVAKAWPAWQQRYVELVRTHFEKLGVVDTKEVSKGIDKQDMKKAMPFVQTLKRRLDHGEKPEAVLERKLAFDEVSVLKEMAPGIMATVHKLVDVTIVIVDDGAKSGVNATTGEKLANLLHMAASAEPGSPSFGFENV